MASRISPLLYLLALVAGLLPGNFAGAAVFSDTTSSWLSEIVIRASIVAVFETLVALPFGFVWPALSWRWGVWISLPGLILATLLGRPGSAAEPGYRFLYLTILAVVPSSACGGAATGSWLASRGTGRGAG
jgi:hypothetical protein